MSLLKSISQGSDAGEISDASDMQDDVKSKPSQASGLLASLSQPSARSAQSPKRASDTEGKSSILQSISANSGDGRSTKARKAEGESAGDEYSDDDEFDSPRLHASDDAVVKDAALLLASSKKLLTVSNQKSSDNALAALSAAAGRSEAAEAKQAASHAGVVIERSRKGKAALGTPANPETVRATQARHIADVLAHLTGRTVGLGQ